MSKKIKDGWYIAASSGSDKVTCVAFYLDDEVRKHIADAMKMLKMFNRVEGRFCTISVGLDLPEIFFLNISTQARLKELFPKGDAIVNDPEYLDIDPVLYAGDEFDQDALTEDEEFAVMGRAYEVDENFISITALDGYSDARVSSCDIFQLYEDYEDSEIHSQE